MSKSVITMTKTVQRLQEQLAIAWDRVTKAERETIEKDEQLAEAKQWKDISVHQGLKIKLMEKENAELQTAYNDYIGRNNRLIEGNLKLKKENAELRERLKSRRGVDEFGGD